MTRPAIAPDVAAALLAAVPPRLLRKLDAEPNLAAAWTWSDAAVTTDKGETVALAIEAGVVTAVACSCLLNPRCLHVAAVVSALPPAAAVGAAPAPEAVEAAAPPAVSAAAVEAAAATFSVLATVLAAGAEATGAFAQASLLRAIHAARTEGLHRLAAACIRVLRSIRALRADEAEFALGTLTADLREALAVAHALGAGDASSALVGSARREYLPAGSLRLRGVFTEAVIARTGYAGAVTYLVDDAGRFFTRADVAPGEAARAAAAYAAPAGVGDAVLSHRELSRSGLFLSDATASADGRLGAGQRVRAVRASEPSRWDHPAIAARFAVPLAQQLAALAARDDEPEALRPAGWDLLCVEGTLDGGALVVGDVALRLTTFEHRALVAHDNLAVLARVPGLRLRAIGRARLAAPRELALLAIAPDETRLPLPAAYEGRVNLHYDRIEPPRAAPPVAPARVAAAPEPPPDLSAVLRRRIERAVLGGAGTLPAHALADLDREAAALAHRALRGGADALRDLAAVAQSGHRDASGARRGLDRDAFARAWLRAALYEAATRRRLSIARW